MALKKAGAKLAIVIAVAGPVLGGTVGVLSTRWIAWLAGLTWEPGWGGMTGTIGAIIGACCGGGFFVYVMAEE